MPSLPVGTIFVFIYKIIDNLIKLLLQFGLKNNIFTGEYCHFCSLIIKVWAIALTLLDIYLEKNLPQQVVL